jgi:hypothetical protein
MASIHNDIHSFPPEEKQFHKTLIYKRKSVNNTWIVLYNRNKSIPNFIDYAGLGNLEDPLH